MTKIIRSGKPDSLGNLDTTQGDFRSQIDALTDAMRQLAGDPEIAPGTTTVNNPLNAPYTLYVDANIGKDTFVTGDYAAADDGSYEQKMKRISLQRLQCGYTVSRPFRTISRAVIEAGIITSRDYLNIDPAPCGDLVTIIVGSGVHTALNGEGGTVSGAWTDGYEPTDAELTEFNPSNGGVVLPRGCSVVSLDLRKTIIRPDFVPEPIDEGNPLLTRHAIFKLTGGNYAYGFTFMDKPGFDKSHHLLDGFQFAGETELDEFYANIRAAFSGVAGINDAYAVPRPSEYRITGPQPPTPIEAVDTTKGSSPYIYNISLRSEWGMCGMWASGDIAVGFRSMVVAQYTGVSLQRDLNSWQRYSGGVWTTFTDYNQFIAENPNNVRFNPARPSYHVRTSSNAVIQEVSVFAIGQAIHHLAESGSQITITNSNSNFGGCAAIATGFLDVAAPEDTPWDVSIIRRALSPFDKTGNIKKIFLGTIEAGVANNATILKLTADFDPEVLRSQEYSLEGNNYLWIDNPGGPDYRSLLTVNPWEVSAADEIDIQTAVTTDDADGNQVPDGGNELPNIAGLRIYVRRLRDVRSVEERRYSIILSMGGNERLPIRDYVIQPETGAAWVDRIQAIAQVESTDTVTNGANIELRYSARPDSDTAFSATTYYRPADTVRRDNKHWTARVDNYGTWDPTQWDESYVHMNSDNYCPEGFFTNAQPIIIFNEDKSQAEDSATLGNSLGSGIEKAQLISGVDYEATSQFLRNLGEDAAAVETQLTPQLKGDRNLDVSPKFWVVEFRRPTSIRLFGHAFEWAGYTNYSKALPQYQGDLSQSNQFTYYFTNEDGGKVYGSGFNQDGLLVTPRGLQDVTTGETLDLENISNPDRPIDIPEVELVWSRAGTTLLPTNLGDDVTIVSPGGAVNISLNNDGSAEFEAKIETASTVQADPGKTLVTKDYLGEAGKGAEGDLGFWTREGTDLYPVNGNTDSVKIGGVLPGAPAISLNANGSSYFDSTLTLKSPLGTGASDAGVRLTPTGSVSVKRAGAGSNTGSAFVVDYGTIRTFLVEAQGNVNIGGTITGDPVTNFPSISLKEDGSASFASDAVYVYDGVSAPGTIRLGETTGTSYGGLAMYRSDQTENGQFFRCFSGASREQVFELDEEGTVRIGGVLPASPNITLNAGNGSASFAGDIQGRDLYSRTTSLPSTSNTGFYVGGGNGIYISSSSDSEGSATLWRGFSTALGAQTSRIAADGSAYFGGVLPDAPNITLGAAGASSFMGRMYNEKSDTDTGSNIIENLLLRNADTSNTANKAAILGFSVFGPAEDENCVAEIRGIKETTTVTSASALSFWTRQSSGPNAEERVRINSAGTLQVGGLIPASPAISLNASGSIETVGSIYSHNAAATTGVFVGTDGFVTATHATRDELGVFTVAVNGGDNTAVIYGNGQGSFQDGIYIGGDIAPTSEFDSKPAAPNIELNADGTISAVNTTIQPISSERRLKENIVAIDADTAWETIKSTPYYTYNFIGNETTSYGPMADEVPAEMVVQPMLEDEDGVKVARSDEEGPIRTYDNGMLQARLYTALQTALTRIEALEAEVNALKGN